MPSVQAPEKLLPRSNQPAFRRLNPAAPAQRFFLAWGQIRCENQTPEAERQQALGNEHATGRARVDGVVTNMPEFARAFRCPAGAAMVPARRCRLW